MRHIHLHPVGGVAGDMLAACLLGAFTEHREAVLAAATAVAGVACRLVPHDDGTLTGWRFLVEAEHHDHGHHHHHTAWRDIRALLDASALPPDTKRHAIGIFATLADAEARVHGCPVDDVTFHEVGAIDSIADIVTAAALLDAIGPASWSIAPLPVGGGMVRTAHGSMPVPAPATALLLEGFAMHDDGVPGERVTPTGAAILRYLDCAATPQPPGVLRNSGYGFGTRTLPGLSNYLRALVFDTTATKDTQHRELAVISFEVDDQSGEDLANGLDRVRAIEGVHDIVQMPAFGKKSRLAIHVQVLTNPAALDATIDACFRETTTIGLRTHLVAGRALPRRFATVEVEGHPLSVKLVDRPMPDGGHVTTGKAEADHVRPIPTQAARARLRRDAEHLAVEQAARVDKERAAQAALTQDIQA